LGSSVALEQCDLLSLLALRQRAIRLWLAAIGVLSFGVAYVGPLALSFRLPAGSPPAALSALSLPAVSFPTLGVPKLHAPAVGPRAHVTPLVRGAAPASRRRVIRHPAPTSKATTRTVRVPVVSNSYTLLPPAVTKKKEKPDPFAG